MWTEDQLINYIIRKYKLPQTQKDYNFGPEA
jgi:hypothetical protein